MTNQVYKAAFEQTKKDIESKTEELGTAIQRVEELERSLAELHQSAALLAKQCGESYSYEYELGITDAIRSALKNTGSPLTASGIKAKMDVSGFNTAKYKNVMAGIHTVLKRLEEKGEIEVQRTGNATYYSWKRDVNEFMKRLAGGDKGKIRPSGAKDK